MKIGILIKKFENLANWELRIVNEIIDNPETELTLLIQDGREEIKINNSKNKFGRSLFQMQCAIEKSLYKQQFTVDKKNIISQLKTTDVIKLCPKRKEFVDIFSTEDEQKIEAYDLDIIVKLEFNAIEGSLINAAKHGIWSFQYGHDQISSSNLVGFREITLKQPYVEVTLQKSKSAVEGVQIVDKAFFNRHWSFVKTNRLVHEGSVSLLFKNIRKLKSSMYSPYSASVEDRELGAPPNFKNTTKYITSFYGSALDKLVRDTNTALFGARYRCWTLFIGEGDFMDANLSSLIPTKMPKDEFWADPFILNYKEEKYIFFENYSYKTKRGKISCGKIRNNELVEVKDVLDVDYHLSFPYIFEENGELFLMPETKENNRLELYRCVDFPGKWELYTTAFEGEKVVDAFFYDDDDRQRWLFINKKADLNSPADSELYIYRVQSLKLNNLEPHKLNPVVIDARKARNGGEIFKYKDEIYRPSQANINGVYGNALNINKIEKLTIDDYVEKDVVTIYPTFYKGLISSHHLHQSDGLFVIDGAYRKR